MLLTSLMMCEIAQPARRSGVLPKLGDGFLHIHDSLQRRTHSDLSARTFAEATRYTLGDAHTQRNYRLQRHRDATLLSDHDTRRAPGGLTA